MSRALCEGNPPLTGGICSQRASNVEGVSMGCYHQKLEKTTILDSVHNFTWNIFQILRIRCVCVGGGGGGDVLNIKILSYQYRDPYVKEKRSCNRLIFNMGIPIPGKTVFVLRQGPEHFHTRLLLSAAYLILWIMMTSSNGNIFRVTGPLWGEFTGYWWIPLTKASDAELWCFLRSAPEQKVE